MDELRNTTRPIHGGFAECESVGLKQKAEIDHRLRRGESQGYTAGSNQASDVGYGPVSSGVRDRVFMRLKEAESNERQARAAHRAWDILERHPELADLIDQLQILNIIPQ